MNVLAVVSTKGGVGKTTLASALAVRAAKESKRVAMVDLDPQGSLAAWWKRRGGSENPKIFAHIRSFSEDIVLCVHNLARTAQAVELDLSMFSGRVPVEMLGNTRFPQIGELPYLLTLGPRGFFWFQLQDPADDE